MKNIEKGLRDAKQRQKEKDSELEGDKRHKIEKRGEGTEM